MNRKMIIWFMLSMAIGVIMAIVMDNPNNSTIYNIVIGLFSGVFGFIIFSPAILYNASLDETHETN